MEDTEQVKKMMDKQNGNVKKEREDLKSNQKEVLGMKSTVTEMKILPEGYSKADLSR